MGEFVMKRIVHDAHRDNDFYIESAGTHDDGVGYHPYKPVREIFTREGIDWGDKRGRQLEKSDYERFDLFIGMDRGNVEDMRRLFDGDPEGKVTLLLDYAGMHRDVADPWYTRDFETSWNEVNTGCKALYDCLTQY